jgi:hypothetical protein
MRYPTLEEELFTAGCSIDADAFRHLILKRFHEKHSKCVYKEHGKIKHGHYDGQGLLREPRKAFAFCEAIRAELNAPLLEDPTILRTLVNEDDAR